MGNNHFHFDYNVSILRLSHNNSQQVELIHSDEIFRSISGYNNYQVSNYGRLKNQYDHIRAPRSNNNNYYSLQLWNDGKPKDFMIHHLVAESFISNPNNFPFVKHKDNNTLNNHSNNLYYTNKRPRTKISNFNNRYIFYKPHLNQYELQIYFQKKSFHLGHYDTIEEAQQVRDKKLNELKLEYEKQQDKLETHTRLFKNETKLKNLSDNNYMTENILKNR